MNAEVERYLQRATRGVWGRRRVEVKEELKAHLEGRVAAHRVAGMSEQDAVEKALAELGSPQLVNVGMTRLYTLPTVMGSGLAIIALCLSVMAFWPKGLAQPTVASSFYWPTEACVKAQQMDALYGACRELDTLWLESDSFKTEMRRQNVKVGEGKNLTLAFPNGAYARLTTEPTEMTIDTTSGTTSINTVPGAIAFTDLFSELLNQPGSLWFEGWDNPVVHIGGVTFQLGTEKHRVLGENFYKDMLGSIFFYNFSEPLSQAETTTYYIVDPRLELSRTAPATEIKVEEPGVYGVITSVSRNLFRAPWLPPAKPGAVLTAFEVIRPNEVGTLVARLPKNVTFATTLGSKAGTNTAVLVRFTDSALSDDVGYRVVPPDDITFAAHN